MPLITNNKGPFPGILILGMIILASCLGNYGGKLTLYPAPQGEPASEDFTLKVNEEEVFVYRARVSAWPINQVWPGYQRPLDQTELASFSYFDCSGVVRIELTSAREFSSAKVLPRSLEIVPEVKGRTIRFDMDGPGQLVVELDGYHHAFHLFANPIESDEPDHEDPSVRYFGPGIHHPGIISLSSNETVYITGGAIVHGIIEAKGADNIRIAGRGILDASGFGRFEGPNMVYLRSCTDVRVEGIILRDPHKWTLVPDRCFGVTIDNVKLIGLWRYNADGIDIVNSQDVLVENCFVRAFDDNIVLKGLMRGEDTEKGPDLRNILVRRCVLWNDWGRPLKIGTETKADSITGIVFEDCDIVHFVHYAMDMMNGARAVISNVTFRDIRVGEPIMENAFIGERPYDPAGMGRLVGLKIRQYREADTIRGKITGIRFENIRYHGSNDPTCLMQGFDPEHRVEDINFENIIIHDRKINSPEDLRIDSNEFVKDVSIK